MINEIVMAGTWILLPYGLGIATGVLMMSWAMKLMAGDCEEDEMECDKCKVVEMCRKMFGKYWEDKSSGGKGCRYPVEPKEKEPEEDFGKTDEAPAGEYCAGSLKPPRDFQAGANPPRTERGWKAGKKMKQGELL